ncbi:MAG: ribonuclease P protein component [Kiritimatiellae bacterium]|nr:ribonuclease P protein component [Kiritimatiellia bacterium]
MVKAVPDQGLSRRQRLTRSSLFQDTYQQGRRWVGRYMVLWLREGDGASLRVGAAASRRVGGAVIRGRAKRRLREIFRQNRYKLSGSYDVVLVARRGLDQAPWNEVVKEFLGLVQKAGIQLGKEKL